MPTYEYACEACGHKFEEFQSIKAKPTTRCPVCKKKKVKRLISGGAGFLFKGSGFYITDYRSDAYKAAAKSDSAPAPAAAPNAATTPSAPPSTTSTTPPSTPASPPQSSPKSDSKPSKKK